MASRIVPTNIDGTFPVAGQDNSSQGFRDNFTNTKNNFTFARNEISDLQSKALLTAALDGSTLNNDMAGTQLIRPQLKAWTQALVDLGSISGTATVSFSVGNFQKITAAGAVTLALSGWPAVGTAGGYGSVRVWIVISDYTTQTLTLPASEHNKKLLQTHATMLATQPRAAPTCAPSSCPAEPSARRPNCPTLETRTAGTRSCGCRASRPGPACPGRKQ